MLNKIRFSYSILSIALVLFLVAVPASYVFARDSQTNVIVPGVPEITILGSNPTYLRSGEQYNDAGATAIDYLFRQIPVSVISNNVNSTRVGDYQIIYSATNDAGNTSTSIRYVKVLSTRRSGQLSDISSQEVGGQIEPNAEEFLPAEGEVVLTLPEGFCFTKNLDPYTTDLDVKNLQIFLNNQGFNVSVYGLENDYYGENVISSIASFQKQNTIIPFPPFGYIEPNGEFNEITRAKVNLITGCSHATTSLTDIVDEQIPDEQEIISEEVGDITKVQETVNIEKITTSTIDNNLIANELQKTVSTTANIPDDAGEIGFWQMIVDYATKIYLAISDFFSSILGF